MCYRFIVALTAMAIAVGASADLGTAELTVDHLRNPLGIDNPAPRFSWKLQTDQHSTLQSAYELSVSIAGDDDSAAHWSSGKVTSAQSLFIPYGGPALKPLTEYEWRVRVWDNHGNVSPWSERATWETGFMQPEHWSSSWITYPWQEALDRSEPSPMLRRDFDVGCDIARARLYVTALGLYEAVINGRRIGDAYFTPGWTSYDKRLQYQVYDVADALHTGQNAIGIVLGDGWYRGNMTWETQRNLYGDRLAAKAQLRVACTDGSEQVLDTDTRWQAGTGAIRASDIYNGEILDLRREPPGWSLPGFADKTWQAAVDFTGATPPLVASVSEPVRATKIIQPVGLLQGPGGETIVDMGQNMVGWVQLQVAGKSGDEIVLRHAEVLDQNGALYLAALRNAQQQVTYILPDTKPHTLEPHFTFQGFRYVSIEGFPGELTLDAIKGIVLSSDMAATGTFETSNALLNQLQSNIVWGQRGNFLDIPTDCPQRDERMGWTGDAQVFARTAMYNMGSAAFFSKWLADVRGDQFSSGAIPTVVPDVLRLLDVNSVGTFFLAQSMPASGWSDVITELPMALYERYGDSQPLAGSYLNMQRWVGYQRAHAASWWRRALDIDTWRSAEYRKHSEFIWNIDRTYGDWLAPQPLSWTFVNTAYFARSTQLLAEAAAILGKDEDHTEYRQLFDNIQHAFQAKFLTAEGTLSEDVQGAYVLALQFDLLDADAAVAAARRLDQLVRDNGYHLATGFLSTPYLLNVLQRYGYVDTAYRVLMQEGHPSWLYPISKGATTIWERWGSIQADGSFGDDGMNSFNHYAYGAVGDWMYQNIGGIAAAAPGYKHMRIAPLPGGGLQHASATFNSPYGDIHSSWRVRGDALEVDVRIPPNTTADLVLPGPQATLLRDGKPIERSAGIQRISDEQAMTVITLGSGQYTFSAAVN